MKVLDPGHRFELAHLDGDATSVLTFVKREGGGYPGNAGHYEGTNLQEVLRALVSRVQYLDGQIHHERNVLVLQHLRAALYQLEERAAERHGRRLGLGIQDLNQIETMPTCPACGHIGCDGTCHARSVAERKEA